MYWLTQKAGLNLGQEINLYSKYVSQALDSGLKRTIHLFDKCITKLKGSGLI